MITPLLAPNGRASYSRMPAQTPFPAERRILSVLDDSEVSRILVVVAHPDDVDFSAAGTIAGWTDGGIEVSYCIVSDGAAGGSDPSVSRADMAALRQAEQ